MARTLLTVMVCAAGGCVVQSLDLRGFGNRPAGDGECGFRERFNTTIGRCVPCEYRSPHPHQGCLCAWEFREAELPYCDTEDAYYECLPCRGSLESCNAYDAVTSTTYEPQAIFACCDELAADPGSACCPDGEVVKCILDPASDHELTRYVVGCLPEPCCKTECTRPSDCDSFQDCIDGFCTPDCQADETCAEFVPYPGAVGCGCQPIGSPG